MKRWGMPAGLVVSLALATGLGLPQATHAGGGISIEMTVTPELTPGDSSDDICGSSDRVEVSRGTQVDLCFTVVNNSGNNVTRHDLIDSELGVILDDFPFTLVPDASAFISVNADDSKKTTHSGRWIAAGTSSVEEATDSARVKVLTCKGYKDDMRAHVIGSNGFDSLTAPDMGAVMCGLGDRDDLFGGDGKDLIIGGEGKDTMIGGGGQDTCLVDKKDIVTDCEKEKKA